MIRINLLPVKRKKKSKPIPPVLIQAGIIFIVTVLAVVFFTFHLYGKVSDLKDTKASKERRIAELQEKLKEVENYERDNQLYIEKSQIIEQLKKQQKAPLRLLDEVSARLTKGIWLTSLNDNGGLINIAGYSFSNSELVSYVQNLKKSKYLTEVALLESRQAKLGTVSLYKFMITFRLKV